MISRSDAYKRLRRQGYKVDASFQPDHGGIFCLGWKWVGEICRTVMSDGSVQDTIFHYQPSGFISEQSTWHMPGVLFPEVNWEG